MSRTVGEVAFHEGIGATLGVALGASLLLFALACRQPPVHGPDDELALAWANRVERPNIVLILVDTLRKDRLGAYGSERDASPNLDHLAAESVVYERAFSQSSWTFPAVAALLTSQYPSALGIRGMRQELTPSAVFLQQILSANGYRTHAVVSHSFVDQKWGFGRGFDSFQSFAGGHRVVTSDRVTDAAIGIVDQIGEQPTFLLVHYFDPHYVYIEHEAFSFSGSPTDPESEWWLMPFGDLRAAAQEGRISPQQATHLLDLYDSEIAFTDFHIGRLLARLEEDGVLDNSIVILTADHGEEFLDHGGVGHGITLYNEQINVPLFIRWPGVSVGQRSHRSVAHVDLLPTLLDYLGIAVEHQLHGLRIQDRTPVTPIFAETRARGHLSAVLLGSAKMVRDHRNDIDRFYDLERDPGELDPLEEHPDDELLLSRLESFYSFAAQARARHQDGVELELSSEELERLKALGYVN